MSDTLGPPLTFGRKEGQVFLGRDLAEREISLKKWLQRLTAKREI